MSQALVWLRRDFRTEDHPSLSTACASHSPVHVAFVFDPRVLAEFESGSKPFASFFGALLELRRNLQKRGTDIHLLEGDPATEIPRLAAQLKVTDIYAARDYEPASRQRDDAVVKNLQATGKRIHLLKDSAIFDEAEILTGDRKPYRVFTPYRNTHFARAEEDGVQKAPPVRWQALFPWQEANPKILEAWHRIEVSVAKGIADSSGAIRPGESAAQQRFAAFLERGLEHYTTNRNLPSVDGTSRISQDLRNGTLSPRQVWIAVKESKCPKNEKFTFLSELAWRDFFYMIAFHFPHAMTSNFNRKYDRLAWRNDPAEFQAWCQGRTGYPIVDAGMHELLSTGFMHNRVRMISAMFLTKDLLIDWRWGEQFFRQHLVDADLCVNNGNWQWCASTGVDAQPYFRVFNPASQAKKFDPQEEYVRRHLPGTPHPSPLVDHAEARLRCLAAFKKAATD